MGASAAAGDGGLIIMALLLGLEAMTFSLLFIMVDRLTVCSVVVGIVPGIIYR